MSEYQYYEFLAVDRPLDGAALAAVRSLSTRARVTPTSFVNTYHWGDFKGDPQVLVERYYDAFLYTANWGTRQLMLRLPARLLDLATAEQYCVGDAARAWAKGGHVVLDLVRTCEEGGEWDDEDTDGEGRLASMISARADLAAGDLRLLYLAWLHAVSCDQVDPGDVEPPVPAGLAALPGSLRALADFLHLDGDLLTVAAQVSASPAADAPAAAAWADRIADLPPEDKDALLLRVVDGDPYVGAELRRRLAPPVTHPERKTRRRTVAELIAGAERAGAERERLAAERRAYQRAAQEKAAAAARSRRLDALAAQGETAWQRVDALIRATRPKEYDEAVTLLVDLRDLAAREGRLPDAQQRVQQLRATYPNRPALLQRLDRAELTSWRAAGRP